MESDMTLKELMKIQVMLVMLYGLCDIMVIIFFQGLNSWEKWKIEILKICIALLLTCFIMLIFFYLVKSNNRRIFGYVFGVEILTFSLNLFISMLVGYYEIYEKLNWKMIYTYIAMIIVAYILSRKASKSLYKKILSKQKPDDDNNYKIEDGVLYGIVLSTLAFSRRLTIDGRYVVNSVLSLIICFAWLFLGWFMFQGKKAYIDNLREDKEK